MSEEKIDDADVRTLIADCAYVSGYADDLRAALARGDTRQLHLALANRMAELSLRVQRFAPLFFNSPSKTH